MTSTVIYDENLRTIATHLQSGTVIQTDAPVDNQGNGERFSPSDLVATALGSCMLTIMGIKARDMNVNMKGTRVDIQKLMRQEPRRIGGINLTFSFPPELSFTDKERIILERAADTCPVIYSIHPEIEVKVVFHWPTEHLMKKGTSDER